MIQIVATMRSEDGAKVEFLHDESRDGDAYQWRVTARNGEVIGASDERFSSMHSAKRNLSLLVLSVQEIAIAGWQAG